MGRWLRSRATLNAAIASRDVVEKNSRCTPHAGSNRVPQKGGRPCLPLQADRPLAGAVFGGRVGLAVRGAAALAERRLRVVIGALAIARRAPAALRRRRDGPIAPRIRARLLLLVDLARGHLGAS